MMGAKSPAPRPSDVLPDPPSPPPWRCMEVGAAVADIFAASPWRVALIASASWSHAFLSPTNGYLWADLDADRMLFDALKNENYDVWRQRSTSQVEQAGQHEILNWMLSGYSVAELIARGYSEKDVEVVRRRVDGTHWKRRLPT